MVKRLQSLNTKWWWHELALVGKIGLEGSETSTARELLALVVSQAEATAPSSFACEKQAYGTVEQFQTAPAIRQMKLVVSSRPRYFLVGNVRGPNERITMQQQNQLLNAIQGKKAARIKDPYVIQRRQVGWKDWGERRWNTESYAFQQKELPAIQQAFEALFDKPDNFGLVAEELRTVLYQSNLIGREQFAASTAEETVTTTGADDGIEHKRR